MRHVAALVLPPLCVGCRVVLPATEGVGVCHNCWKTLPFWRKGQPPMPQLPPMVHGFAAPFLYEGKIQEWVTALKFNDRLDLAPVLGEFMVPMVPKMAQLLVPVPMFAGRLRVRKFNQAAELTKVVSRKTAVPWSHNALLRVADTKNQVGKTRQQRLQLPLNAFKADGAQVQGKHVVLIDDIWTTGTTARVCATVLRKAGAKHVDVVTVAYVEA